MLAISGAATSTEAAERLRRECYLALTVPSASKSLYEKIHTLHGAAALAEAMEKYEHERLVAASGPNFDNILGLSARSYALMAEASALAALGPTLHSSVHSSAQAMLMSSANDELNRMAFNATAHAWIERETIERLRVGLASDATYHEIFEREAERQKAYEDAFRIPSESEYARLAADAFNTSGLAAKTLAGSIDVLSGLMAGMDAAWIRTTDALASVVAFSEIQSIGKLTATADPFDISSVSAIRANLGDWRDPEDFSCGSYIDPLFRSQEYLRHGFNSGLTDFPVPAFEQTIAIAGFYSDEMDDNPLDSSMEGNHKAYAMLLRFERKIRSFISHAMYTSFGEHWMKRQLPQGMLDRWMEKKEAAEKNNADSLLPIEYADFTDYKLIIERKDNWDQVFSQYFGRKEDIRESFQRLFPVRIATMHSRIVTLDDQLLLLVEIRRITKAIKRQVSRQSN
jgi:hypothetical protein